MCWHRNQKINQGCQMGNWAHPKNIYEPINKKVLKQKQEINLFKKVSGLMTAKAK